MSAVLPPPPDDEDARTERGCAFYGLIFAIVWALCCAIYIVWALCCAIYFATHK